MSRTRRQKNRRAVANPRAPCARCFCEGSCRRSESTLREILLRGKLSLVQERPARGPSSREAVAGPRAPCARSFFEGSCRWSESAPERGADRTHVTRSVPIGWSDVSRSDSRDAIGFKREPIGLTCPGVRRRFSACERSCSSSASPREGIVGLSCVLEVRSEPSDR